MGIINSLGLLGHATTYAGFSMPVGVNTSLKSSFPLPLLSQAVPMRAIRSSIPSPVGPVLFPVNVSITDTVDVQPGELSPAMQYLVSVVPSMMLALYSAEPPPLPSKSSAPYQPWIALASAPTLTAQLAPNKALPCGLRQSESPCSSAHGISL